MVYEDKGLEKLLLSIKNSVDHLQLESESKKDLHDQTAYTLVKVQECLSTIKVEVTRLKRDQINFIEARKDRTINCDKVHADFEQRLRDNPPIYRCTNNEIRLEHIEQKVEQFIPILYKIIGGVIVIAIVVPPIVTGLVGFFVKHFTKGS